MTPREHAKSAVGQLPGRLKAARKLASLTQDELADAASLSSVALSKFETGVNLPNFENLVALAHALQTSPNYLTGWELGDQSPQGERKRAAINRLLLSAELLSVDWIDQLTQIAEKARSG